MPASTRGALLVIAVLGTACSRSAASVDDPAEAPDSAVADPRAGEQPAPTPGRPLAGTPSAVEAARAEASTREPTEDEIEAMMRRHFEEVGALKEAVIDGDVSAAHEQAQWFLEHQAVEAYPHAWRPHVTRMLESAASAAQAQGIDGIAMASAKLAGACGNCHRAVGAKPVFPDAVEPEVDDRDAGDQTPEQTMERHQWAADRLWEGVVGPSSDRWTQGAAGFTTIPGCTEAEDPKLPSPSYARALCQRVHLIGRHALRATEHAERTRLLGEFLSTCAACHEQVDAAGPK